MKMRSILGVAYAALAIAMATPAAAHGVDTDEKELTTSVEQDSSSASKK